MKILQGSNKLSAIIVLIMLSSFSIQKQIEVPAIQDQNPVSVKLGLSRTIMQPDFEFERVYRRQVHEVREDGQYIFPPCHENPPEIQFEILDQIVFQGIPKKPLIITDFEDIKYSQFLLDIYYQDSNVYIIFKNGRIAVITLKQDQTIKQKNVFDVSGLSFEQNYLEVGYFIKVSNDLLFVNNNKTIKVGKSSASVLKGYESHEQFQSVYPFENGTFGVLQSRKGLTVYDYDGSSVKMIQKFEPKQIFSSLSIKPQLVDLVYWSQKKTLLLLDKFDGIRSYSVSIQQFESTEADSTSAKTIKKVTIKQTDRVSPTTNCKLMYLYSTTLYAYCDALYAYQLDAWPRVEQRILPYPNVEVKQIYELDNIIALVGKNVFTVLYLERLVNYYEDGNLDKLLFYKNMFISANEEGVDIGKVVIIKPYIVCQAKEDKYIGVTNLVFKTKAECNVKYFQQSGINEEKLGIMQQDDVCVYTIYKPISFWKEGQIKTYPFIIGIVVVLVIVIVAVVVFLLKRRKISQVMQLINEYSSMNSVSDTAKPHNLNEEMDGGVETNAQRAQSADKQDAAKKESEVQLADKVFDIA